MKDSPSLNNRIRELYCMNAMKCDDERAMLLNTQIRTSFYEKGRKVAVYACFRKFGRVHLHLMNELISVLPKMLFEGPPKKVLPIP